LNESFLSAPLRGITAPKVYPIKQLLVLSVRFYRTFSPFPLTR